MKDMKVFVYADPYLPDERIRSTLHDIQKYFAVVPEPESAELIFVLGGDGAMLDAIRAYHSYHLPFFGVNFGGVGFLLNDTKYLIEDDMDNAVRMSDSIDFPLMDVSVTMESGEVAKTFAFNDVYTQPGKAHTCCHRILINGEDLMAEFDEPVLRGNGIIYATPGGCTAYSYFAGGVYTLPDQGQFVLTPNVATRPNFHRFRSRAIPDSSIVTIELLERHRRMQYIIADNQGFENAVSATITRSTETVRLTFLKRFHYYEKVIRSFSYNGR